jgi:hypothetical protein
MFVMYFLNLAVARFMELLVKVYASEHIVIVHDTRIYEIQCIGWNQNYRKRLFIFFRSEIFELRSAPEYGDAGRRLGV